MSINVQMVIFATHPSNVLQDVVQAITFAEPKYQTVTVVKVTGRIVNQDMTIGENVSNVNHIVTAQVDNSVTEMLAILLSIAKVIGVDVRDTAITGTKSITGPVTGRTAEIIVAPHTEQPRHVIGYRVVQDTSAVAGMVA